MAVEQKETGALRHSAACAKPITIQSRPCLTRPFTTLSNNQNETAGARAYEAEAPHCRGVAIHQKAFRQPYAVALSWPRCRVTTRNAMGQTVVTVAPPPPRPLTLRPLAARSAALASGSELGRDVRSQR